MELDDLKNAWNNASQPENKQQKLAINQIDQMTQKKYDSKIRKIALPEIFGSIICVLGTVFIGLHFYKLDTVPLQVAGIAAIVLLLLLSTLALLSIRRLTIQQDVNKPYAETLASFAIQKLRFVRLQKTNVVLAYLLLVTVIVLMSKLFNGTDLAGNKSFWIFSMTLGYIFLLFYSRWVLKHYRNTLQQAEELLHELHS